MKRQQIRRLTLFLAFMLFPLTIWYFSPALIIVGAMRHILNGSFFVFLGMFIASMFLGRTFCGFFCPVGGMQECVGHINSNWAKQGKRKWIKFGIWIVWISCIIISFLTGKGEWKADFFFMTTHGISIGEATDFITYYMVLFLLFLPPLIHGRRASCHYLCWMAPFMMLGEKVGQLLHLPQLHITAKEGACVSCKNCNKACNMGIDVQKRVQEKGEIKCLDCIQCGACVDNCPNKVLSYSMKRYK